MPCASAQCGGAAPCCRSGLGGGGERSGVGFPPPPSSSPPAQGAAAERGIPRHHEWRRRAGVRPVPAQPSGGLRAHPAHRQRHLRRRLQGRRSSAGRRGCVVSPSPPSPTPVGSVASCRVGLQLLKLRGASFAKRRFPLSTTPFVRLLLLAARSPLVPPRSHRSQSCWRRVGARSGRFSALEGPCSPRLSLRWPGRPLRGEDPRALLAVRNCGALRFLRPWSRAGSRFLPLLGAGSGVRFTGGAWGSAPLQTDLWGCGNRMFAR